MINKNTMATPSNNSEPEDIVATLKADLAKSKRELASLRKQQRELKAQVKERKEHVEHCKRMIINCGTCQKSRDRLMALIDRGFSAEYILDRCVDFFSIPCPFDEPWELLDTDVRLLLKVRAGKIELRDIPSQCTVSKTPCFWWVE